ncbi:GNAT family N-acetyltransferase [Stenotrophomonas sp. C3(2023)]|uniref:GNAT family N-acetyltransferase n=1 Tax=Stenotrophomonas sp. C3(2023) TaxID=3080277 RepID=UPI00293C58D7|nr:GNAT family N-acetyltransferase [Stenotrophomonas sp. C3(2023)]MDV3467976.1 GNAT family N-acetyltransferase [Stenotrophomonas sp. C3(2023)]
MATRNRMPPWHETFKAPSGHELLIRPIRPEDGAPLQAAFSLFGPEEIRDRFLQAVTELSPETTQRLTHPNPKSEITLVAAESLPAGDAVVGAVARASIIAGTRDAEYAILVSRFLIGQGLGRQLMRKLVKWARGKYLDRLYGDVAEENEPMKQLAASLGFKPMPHPQGTPGLVRMVLELDN